MTTSFKRAVKTYRSGGPFAVFSEGRRYWRSHPYRVLLYAKFRAARLSWFSSYNVIASPTKILYVSPAQIKRSTPQFSTSTDVGRIVGGEWDRKANEFTDKIRYRAIRDHYIDNCSWQETGIFDHYLEQIESKGRYDGCYTIEDVERRYRRINRMYESMKETGYDESRVENVLDHVCVNIGRDGELLHAGVGNHRLSIAKLLDLDEIPVRVVVRHEEWQQKRERLNAREDNIPHSDLHPDLQDCL